MQITCDTAEFTDLLLWTLENHQQCESKSRQAPKDLRR
jgi:hypothetical protein